MLFYSYHINKIDMNSKSNPISRWAIEDRPLEKLISLGAQDLSNSELLALILGSGTPGTSAVELSRNILSSCSNSLDTLSKLDLQTLKNFKGVGDTKAVRIIASLELGKRRKYRNAESTQIKSSSSISEIMIPILCDIPHEEFWVIYLNRANKIITKRRSSQGGINGTVIDPRVIYKSAVELQASAIILCHNHPSGNLKPSTADKVLTKKLVEGGQLLDISVIDHIIIGGHSYTSFAEEGYI